FDALVKFCRGHCRAANAVAAGFCAEVNDWKTNALGFGKEDRVRLRKACGKCVDQDVAVIARVKFNFAADSWNAEGITVAANTSNNAGDEAAGLKVVR